MIFRHEEPTDEQYVETIRKQYHTLRRTQWLWPILFICFIWCIIKLSLIVGEPSGLDTESYHGFAVGVILGMFFCVIALQSGLTLKQWHDVRHGFRTERLLLKYHDELKDVPNHPSDRAQ